MSDSSKSPWVDPRFLLTVGLLIVGWVSNNAISGYKIEQLQNEVRTLQDLKIEQNIVLLRKDVTTNNRIVKLIAEKLGIVVAD